MPARPRRALRVEGHAAWHSVPAHRAPGHAPAPGRRAPVSQFRAQRYAGGAPAR